MYTNVVSYASRAFLCALLCDFVLLGLPFWSYSPNLPFSIDTLIDQSAKLTKITWIHSKAAKPNKAFSPSHQRPNSTMRFGNFKRMDSLNAIIPKEKKKKTSKPKKGPTFDVPHIKKGSSLSSSVRSSEAFTAATSLMDSEVSSLVMEQDLWESFDTSVDYRDINRLHATWEIIKETVGGQALGERLVRKMIEIEGSSQWLMRLESLEDSPRLSCLCAKLVAALETLVFLLEPGSTVQDVIDCAVEMRDQGVSLDLLADALPICLKSALGDALTEADEQAWRQVVVPALRELEMPALFVNTPLY